MMRMVFVMGLATALLGGAAQAADLPIKKAAPVFVPPPPAFVPPPPVVSWSGFYIGANGGYAGDQYKYPFSGFLEEGGNTVIDGGGSASLSSSGFLGGVQAGYNYQFDASWVSGIEADIDATSIAGKVSLGASGVYNVDLPWSASGAAKSEQPNLGTARFRLGYLITPQFLVFGTGGLAFGQIKTSADLGYNISGDSGALSWSKNATQVGWTAGAGVEYKVNNNWSFKTEYLYVDLGTKTLLSGGYDDGDGGAYGYSLKVHPTDNIVRAGLNYTFN
jgi:outer membrane immunogenic protein